MIQIPKDGILESENHFLAFIDTDNFIVGSPTGGIWNTNDSGNNWNSLTDNLSNIDVWSLEISPDDSNIFIGEVMREEYTSHQMLVQLGH